MKKIGKTLDDTAELIKKYDPVPSHVATVTLLQAAVKELDKQVNELSSTVEKDM